MCCLVFHILRPIKIPQPRRVMDISSRVPTQSQEQEQYVSNSDGVTGLESKTPDKSKPNESDEIERKRKEEAAALAQ